MRRTLLTMLLAAAIPLLAFAEDAIRPAKAPENGPATERKDVGKFFIEMPLKQLVAAEIPPEPADQTKRRLQHPVEALVAETTKTVEIDDNPSVEPGKVDWHEDFAAARAAAEESGKPVLLFHLLGQLDQRFT